MTPFFLGKDTKKRPPYADELRGAVDGGATLLVGHARHAAGRHPGEDADQEHGPAAPRAAL